MRFFSVIYLFLILSFPILAQQINLPIVPIIAEYEYAPQFFSQSFSHRQYSMIEAIVDEDKQPIVQIILTETETKRRVFYTNSKSKAETLKTEAKEVYLTNIDYKKTQEMGQQPTFSFALRDKTGQPIIWQVNYASTPSERGAELTPISQAAGLKIEYRDPGTTVGERTAVQIGETVIEAEYWKERSSPPYFIAYRGSAAVGKHIGALRLGSENWIVQSQPKELKKGERWILTNEKGQSRILEISNAYHEGNEIVVDEIKQNPTALIRLVILITSQGYALRAFEIKSKAEEMRIKFETPLPIHVADSANFESEFSINQGDNKKIISGKIFGVREKDSYTKMTWQFYQPDWTKKNTLESMIKFESKGYSIETKEVTK